METKLQFGHKASDRTVTQTSLDLHCSDKIQAVLSRRCSNIQTLCPQFCYNYTYSNRYYFPILKTSLTIGSVLYERAVVKGLVHLTHDQEVAGSNHDWSLNFRVSAPSIHYLLIHAVLIPDTQNCKNI